MKKRRISRIIISRIVSFLIFLILLAVANALIPTVDSPLYASLIHFFDTSLLILIAMIILGMINDIFWNFYFPFNILAPITSAALSVVVISFLYSFWNFFDSYIHTGLVIPIDKITAIIAFIVFVVGYLVILFRGGKPLPSSDQDLSDWREKCLQRKRERLQKRLSKLDRKVTNNIRENRIEWDDVGQQFKKAFYNLGSTLSRLFESKNSKPIKKKKK